MADYSDNPLAYEKNLLNAMKAAILDVVDAGAVITVRKGSFSAKYTTLMELNTAIKQQELKVYYMENNCGDRKLCP